MKIHECETGNTVKMLESGGNMRETILVLDLKDNLNPCKRWIGGERNDKVYFCNGRRCVGTW
jgi:hypothetical protein